MRKTTDPLIPILGSAVSLVVLGAILLVFVPRVTSWFDQDDGAVVLSLPPLDEPVPLWTCSPQPGVALLIEPLDVSAAGDDPALDSMFEGGPYRYFRLVVYHFEGSEPFRLEIPAQGLDSPEGGERLLPASARRASGLDPACATILAGLGTFPAVSVAPGERAQILLLAAADPAGRTAFLSGDLRFEKRTVTRFALAKWHEQPALQTFQKF